MPDLTFFGQIFFGGLAAIAGGFVALFLTCVVIGWAARFLKSIWR